MGRTIELVTAICRARHPYGSPTCCVPPPPTAGMKASDFARKKLNLVVVTDVSGSMDAPFDTVSLSGERARAAAACAGATAAANSGLQSNPASSAGQPGLPVSVAYPAYAYFPPQTPISTFFSTTTTALCPRRVSS